MRVLVVEDHAPTRSLVESALKGEGHNVESAPSLGSAREQLSGGGFAVIVLDWMLPDGAGPDLCREMRASGLSPADVLDLARRQLRQP